jgi:hypothetical protein
MKCWQEAFKLKFNEPGNNAVFIFAAVLSDELAMQLQRTHDVKNPIASSLGKFDHDVYLEYAKFRNDMLSHHAELCCNHLLLQKECQPVENQTTVLTVYSTLRSLYERSQCLNAELRNHTSGASCLLEPIALRPSDLICVFMPERIRALTHMIELESDLDSFLKTRSSYEERERPSEIFKADPHCSLGPGSFLNDVLSVVNDGVCLKFFEGMEQCFHRMRESKSTVFTNFTDCLPLQIAIALWMLVLSNNCVHLDALDSLEIMFKSSKNVDTMKLNLEELEVKKQDRQKNLNKYESEKDELVKAQHKQSQSNEQKQVYSKSYLYCYPCGVYGHERGSACQIHSQLRKITDRIGACNEEIVSYNRQIQLARRERDELQERNQTQKLNSNIQVRRAFDDLNKCQDQLLIELAQFGRAGKRVPLSLNQLPQKVFELLMLGEDLPRSFRMMQESWEKVIKATLSYIELLDPACPMFKALTWIKDIYSNANIYVKNVLRSFGHYTKFYKELKTKTSAPWPELVPALCRYQQVIDEKSAELLQFASRALARVAESKDISGALDHSHQDSTPFLDDLFFRAEQVLELFSAPSQDLRVVQMCISLNTTMYRAMQGVHSFLGALVLASVRFVHGYSSTSDKVKCNSFISSTVQKLKDLQVDVDVTPPGTDEASLKANLDFVKLVLPSVTESLTRFMQQQCFGYLCNPFVLEQDTHKAQENFGLLLRSSYISFRLFEFTKSIVNMQLGDQKSPLSEEEGRLAVNFFDQLRFLSEKCCLRRSGQEADRDKYFIWSQAAESLDCLMQAARSWSNLIEQGRPRAFVYSEYLYVMVAKLSNELVAAALRTLLREFQNHSFQNPIRRLSRIVTKIGGSNTSEFGVP